MTEAVQRWQKEDAIRKAEVAFLTDEQRRSVEFWWEQLCRDFGCSLPELRRRSQKGRWLARRERYWNAVQQEVLRQTKNRTVHDRVAELSEIQAVRQNTLEMLMPRVVNGQKVYRVQPQSYEGLVRSLVQLDELGDAKRTAVLQTVEPELEREIKRPVSVFTPDEIRGVARMLLEARRARQQQQLQLPAHDKDKENGDRDGQGKDDDREED